MVPGIEQLISCLYGRFDEILNPRWVSTSERVPSRQQLLWARQGYNAYVEFSFLE